MQTLDSIDLQNITVRPEQPADAAAIEQLHDVAIGPIRFTRAAHFLRGQTPARPDLCFVIATHDKILGSVRQTQIKIGAQLAVLLGPLVVQPPLKGQGLGQELMKTAVQAARDHGDDAIILVGDEPYYRRFGFVRVPPGQIIMPAPVDENRILVLDLLGGLDLAGAALAITPL
jgi:predicted N-acetyltransferase YhbS